MSGPTLLARVAGHELRRSLASPGAWLIHAVFLALHGVLLVLLLDLDAAVRGAAEVGSFRESASLLPAHATNVAALLLLFVPIATGGLLVDDDRGAGVLVRSAPVRSGTVVVGKWLGATARLGALTAVAQIPALAAPTMAAGGSRIPWLVASTALLLAACTAIGAAASAAAGRRTGATVAGWAVLLALWTIGRADDGGLAHSLSVGRRFGEMAAGVVRLGDVGLLVGLTVASLGVAAWALEARRWR